MQTEDFYKLLYQGIRGPEHIITSSEVFKERLMEEWNSLDLSVGDPPQESIRVDGSLVRINLRPYKAAGGNLDELVKACLKTGLRTWGTPAELQQAWYEFAGSCRKGKWANLVWGDVEAFTAWLKANGFPPVHHSELYRNLYRPAYRLVLKNLSWQIWP